MKTVQMPERAMKKMRVLRVDSGKLLERLAGDQSSRRTEEMTRTGMVRRLL